MQSFATGLILKIHSQYTTYACYKLMILILKFGLLTENGFSYINNYNIRFYIYINILISITTY